MERINSLFSKNIFVSYPTNYTNKQKTALSLTGKNIFPQKEDSNTEIAKYLDILYKDTNEEFLKKTDKLKLNNAYSPMKCQKLNYGTFYL